MLVVSKVSRSIETPWRSPSAARRGVRRVPLPQPPPRGAGGQIIQPVPVRPCVRGAGAGVASRDRDRRGKPRRAHSGAAIAAHAVPLAGRTGTAGGHNHPAATRGAGHALPVPHAVRAARGRGLRLAVWLRNGCAAAAGGVAYNANIHSPAQIDRSALGMHRPPTG